MSLIVSGVDDSDIEALLEIRLLAMQESLERIGRFDPLRARERFLKRYESDNTRKILIDNQLVGFYVLLQNSDHCYLDHFYFHPNHQSFGFGSVILDRIKSEARALDLPIRLCALKESRSNEFYKKHGFIFTHESEWDNFYEFSQ